MIDFATWIDTFTPGSSRPISHEVLGIRFVVLDFVNLFVEPGDLQSVVQGLSTLPSATVPSSYDRGCWDGDRTLAAQDFWSLTKLP